MTQLKDRLLAGWFFLLPLCLSLGAPAGARAQGTGEFLCNGGTRNGLACESDDNCTPNGVCVIAQGVCNGGGDDGLTCECLNGVCSATPVCSVNASMGVCSGGILAGGCCDTSFNCADSAPCVGTSKVCLSGTNKGLPCLNTAQCSDGTCAATGKFCSGFCQGGTKRNQLCLDDTDCPGSTCTSDFQSLSCVNDSDCCQNPSTTPPACTVAGICRGPSTSTSPTITPTRGTATPSRTRTLTPTGSRTPGTPTPTSSGAAATATPTPSATTTGSPVISAHLTSAISATVASIAVDSAAAFPNAGTIIIDSEQIAYTSKFGNTLVNVQRGANGTTAAAHANGALVRLLSSTVPTPPRPTATSPPRGVIYEAIGQGSGCALQADGSTSTSSTLILTGVAVWALRRRRPR